MEIYTVNVSRDVFRVWFQMVRPYKFKVLGKIRAIFFLFNIYFMSVDPS